MALNPNEPQATLDKHWRSSCRVIFGEDVGPLADYLPWLARMVSPMVAERSAVSGREVTVAFPEPAAGSKWIGFDEVDFAKKYLPLNINEIKDLDSVR